MLQIGWASRNITPTRPANQGVTHFVLGLVWSEQWLNLQLLGTIWYSAWYRLG